jgi:DNA-binding transcriptional LysR family regulator
MDRLTSMTVFARVAATRSFSAAARELGISQATASKHVQTLEGWIGARLLHRTTRRVSLTEAGESFFIQCTRILEDLEAARQTGKPEARLRGALRVLAPIAFGSTRLAALAVDFMRENPALSLTVTLTDRPVDLTEEGFDLAIRIGPEQSGAGHAGGLSVRQLPPVRFVVCATPAYLKLHGLPQVPADLARHACVTDTRHPGDVWRFAGPDGEVAVSVAGPLKTDNALLRREAALRGAGILMAPVFLVEEDIAAGRLVQVLAGYSRPAVTQDLVSPSQRAGSPKVRSLTAFLAARLGE